MCLPERSRYCGLAINSDMAKSRLLSLVNTERREKKERRGRLTDNQKEKEGTGGDCIEC